MKHFHDIAVITGGEAIFAIDVDVGLTEAEEDALIKALGAALCAPAKPLPPRPWAIAVDVGEADWELVPYARYSSLEEAELDARALSPDCCLPHPMVQIVRIDQ